MFLIDGERRSRSFLESVMLLELSQESVAGLLGVAEQHGRVLVEEDRVVHGGVTHTQRSLHHDNLKIENLI
jgi:hypothetical protein